MRAAYRLVSDGTQEGTQVLNALGHLVEDVQSICFLAEAGEVPVLTFTVSSICPDVDVTPAHDSP